MNNKPDSIIRIPCDKESFFSWWLRFLIPVHNLCPKEIDVAACFLRKRHELSKVILDNDLLNKTLMNQETQKEIREECGMKIQNFIVIKGKLKAKKFLVNDAINPKLIPNIKEENGIFQLLLLFEL